MAMTKTQEKYVKMEKQYMEVKAWEAEFDKVTAELYDELGEAGHFQDDEGTVYQAVKPAGTFVKYYDKEILRTRREGETKGTLSLTKAKELGYKDVK